uniref:GpMADS3 protein n=1 Tax=Gnetum parvifolium TaxID=33153 RepID=Q9ST06_GNEPA|nr:GpMADS3 [Gnetum parvifolium]
MGRGRVQLRRIENKINRQVTFSKRRNGLLKKAYELSVLCDAEVALIIFSTRGKLYEFASSSMSKTLERYEKCSYSMQENASTDRDAQNWHHEVTKLKAKLESLHKAQRNLMGEDLGPLNIKELQSLEQQLEVALGHVRNRKTQLLIQTIDELRDKERTLQEVNKSLQKKLSETEGRNVIPALPHATTGSGEWESSTLTTTYALQTQQPSGIHHVDCEPTLHIGPYHQAVHHEAIPGPPATHSEPHNQYIWWV